MAKRKITIELDYDTLKAMRRAAKMNKELKKTPEIAKKTGSQFNVAEKIGKKFYASLASSAGALVGIGAITATVRTLIAALDQAHESHMRLASESLSLQRGLRSPARQFGVSPRTLAGQMSIVGEELGIDPMDLTEAAGTIQSLQSAKVLGSDVMPGGVFAPAARARFDPVLGFIAATGAESGAAAIGSVIRSLTGENRPSPEAITGSLGQIQTAFTASKSTRYGEFITGIGQGVSPMILKGVDPAVALSNFAGLTHVTGTPVAAGRTMEMIYTQAMESYNPAYEDLIPGYGELLANNQGQLMTEIIDLLSPASRTPESLRQSAELASQLSLAPRIASRIRTAGIMRESVTNEARRNLRSVDPSVVQGIIESHKSGDLGIAGGSASATLRRELSGTTDAGKTKAIESFTKEAVEWFEREFPYQKGISDALTWGETNEKEVAVYRYLRHLYYKRTGKSLDYRSGGEYNEAEFTGGKLFLTEHGRIYDTDIPISDVIEKYPEVGEILYGKRGSSGNTTIIGVQNNTSPANLPHNKDTRVNHEAD